MMTWIKKLVYFITTDIWKFTKQELSPIQFFLVREARIVIIAIRGFTEDKIQLRASALTFYSMLAFVPIIALAFAVAKGFGMQQAMEAQIRASLSGHQEVMDWVMTFATKFLDNAKSGFIAGVGIGILLWSVMKVLGHIEESFNDIWQIKKARGWFRKFSDYLSLMFVAPVILILSSSLNVFIANFLEAAGEYVGVVTHVSPIILKLIPYTLIWLLFTVLYMIMPNTNVTFLSAFMAGILAGSAFQLLQWGYIHFQVGVSRYGAIYGSFAALPLFIMWLQLSWLVVLFGAEVSFASQNIEKYEYDSDIVKISQRNKDGIMLLTLRAIVKTFEVGATPLSAPDIAHQLEIPIRIIRDVLHDLTESGIVSESSLESKERVYLPLIDINKIDIGYVYNRVRNSSEGRVEPLNGGEGWKHVKELQEELYKTITQSKANKLLKDL